MNILNRTSNNINIATFWENYNLKKYNFSPEYQRKGDVWSESDKSYLIDTILKNFPMPPIFLHQHIDNDTGKTIYDVIDGKQRLSAIIDFLENKTPVPEDFSDDGFGDSKLEGMYFEDFNSDEFIEWKKNLWKYEITIEYVATDNKNIVNHIFDRLNRNGEPLTNQELRKAQFGNTKFYSIISDASEHGAFENITSKLKSNRLENHEFISELLFLVAEDRVIAGDKPSEIDELYKDYSNKEDQELDAIEKNFLDVEKLFSTFELNFNEKRFYGVSHIYGLWGLAWKLHKENKAIDNLSDSLNSFYEVYKLKNGENKNVEEYRISMSAGTKGASRRLRRIEALYKYVTNA